MIAARVVCCPSPTIPSGTGPPLPRAQEPAIESGTVLADLDVRLQDGTRKRLSDLLADGPLVLFFYPKAFSKGCTAQACHFRDLSAELAEVGAQPVGVSRDDVTTQARFVEEHELGFPLIADEDGTLAKALGAKRPGPLWHRRRTYIIDTDRTLLGEIASESEMERHADEALALLREHAASSSGQGGPDVDAGLGGLNGENGTGE